MRATVSLDPAYLAALERAVAAVFEDAVERLDTVSARRLLAHLEALVAVAEGRDDLAASRLRNELGHALMLVGDPVAAERLFSRALETRRAAGAPSAEVSETLNNLAVAAVANGNPARGAYLLERAIAQASAESDPPSIAGRLLANLARICLASGQLERARGLTKASLIAHVRSLGLRHAFSITSLNDRGVALHAMGEVRKAQTCFALALQASDVRQDAAPFLPLWPAANLGCESVPALAPHSGWISFLASALVHVAWNWRALQRNAIPIVIADTPEVTAGSTVVPGGAGPEPTSRDEEVRVIADDHGIRLTRGTLKRHLRRLGSLVVGQGPPQPRAAPSPGRCRSRWTRRRMPSTAWCIAG